MIAIKQLEVAFGMAKAFVKKVKKSSGAGGLAGERGRERFASSAAPAGHDGAITNVRWPSASSRAGGSRPRSLVMVVEKLERFLKELTLVGTESALRTLPCQGRVTCSGGPRGPPGAVLRVVPCSSTLKLVVPSQFRPRRDKFRTMRAA